MRMTKMIKISDTGHDFLKRIAFENKVTLNDAIHFIRGYYEACFIFEDDKTMKFYIKTRKGKYTGWKPERDVFEFEVNDFENKDMVSSIIENDFTVIKDETIFIDFGRHSAWKDGEKLFEKHVGQKEFNKPGGFNRRDILECIYKEYCNIYEEAEKIPRHWIESLQYDKKSKVLAPSIGT